MTRANSKLCVGTQAAADRCTAEVWADRDILLADAWRCGPKTSAATRTRLGACMVRVGHYDQLFPPQLLPSYAVQHHPKKLDRQRQKYYISTT